MTQKAAYVEWCLKQEKALEQVQTAVQASLPLRPYRSTHPMCVLEVSVAYYDTFCSLWQDPVGESHCRPFRLWTKALQSFVDNNSFLEK